MPRSFCIMAMLMNPTLGINLRKCFTEMLYCLCRGKKEISVKLPVVRVTIIFLAKCVHSETDSSSGKFFDMPFLYLS